jgi:hypothetical protein
MNDQKHATAGFCKVEGTGSFWKALEGSGCFQKVPDVPEVLEVSGRM